MSKCKTVKLTKLKDNRFNTRHPNGINEGYVKEGIMVALPKIGERFYVNDFSTSLVLSEIDENGIFETINSVYKLEIIKNEK